MKTKYYKCNTLNDICLLCSLYGYAKSDYGYKTRNTLPAIFEVPIGNSHMYHMTIEEILSTKELTEKYKDWLDKAEPVPFSI